MHTEGPWRVMKSSYTRDTFVVSGSDTQPFTGQVIAGKTTCPDWRDNAQLIAAAPDLLDACTLALRFLEDKLPDVYDVVAMRNTLRAVIAKAEGKD